MSGTGQQGLPEKRCIQVLFVEDYPDRRELIKEQLKGVKNIMIDYPESYSDVLDRDLDNYDLVVTDYNLAGNWEFPINAKFKNGHTLIEEVAKLNTRCRFHLYTTDPKLSKFIENLSGERNIKQRTSASNKMRELDSGPESFGYNGILKEPVEVLLAADDNYLIPEPTNLEDVEVNEIAREVYLQHDFALNDISNKQALLLFDIIINYFPEDEDFFSLGNKIFEFHSKPNKFLPKKMSLTKFEKHLDGAEYLMRSIKVVSEVINIDSDNDSNISLAFGFRQFFQAVKAQLLLNQYRLTGDKNALYISLRHADRFVRNFFMFLFYEYNGALAKEVSQSFNREQSNSSHKPDDYLVDVKNCFLCQVHSIDPEKGTSVVKMFSVSDIKTPIMYTMNNDELEANQVLALKTSFKLYVYSDYCTHKAFFIAPIIFQNYMHGININL